MTTASPFTRYSAIEKRGRTRPATAGKTTGRGTTATRRGRICKVDGANGLLLHAEELETRATELEREMGPGPAPEILSSVAVRPARVHHHFYVVCLGRGLENTST